jgi:hypothetical protein
MINMMQQQQQAEFSAAAAGAERIRRGAAQRQPASQH